MQLHLSSDAVDYLKSYYDEDIDLNRIYRYMDKLYNTQMELAQQISVEHTRINDSQKSLFGLKTFKIDSIFVLSLTN